MPAKTALVAVSACLVTFTVAAQEPASLPAPPEASDASQESKAGDATVLGEVTVTARRREENLQSVPAAVSVIGGNLLDSSYTVYTQ